MSAPSVRDERRATRSVRTRVVRNPACGSRVLIVTHRQRMAAFVGALLSLLLAALDQTVVSTALPTIASDLHGFSHLSWVVTAYLLASTATVPLYGSLSDL